jgi:hypothetical protein
VSGERQARRLPGLASLEVEPLSDVAWQRVERRLFAGGAIPADAETPRPAPARPGHRRLAVGLAAVGLAAAALALLLWPRAPDRVAPSRIVTADSPSSVSVGDVALEVAARSALLVDDRDGAVLVVLERGELTCRVAPRAGRGPVVVQVGDARIEVVGTAFAAARVGDSARVVVHEGVVEVVQAGRRVRVAAGQTWSGAGEAGQPRTHEPKPEPRPDASGAGLSAPRAPGSGQPGQADEPVRAADPEPAAAAESAQPGPELDPDGDRDRAPTRQKSRRGDRRRGDQPALPRPAPSRSAPSRPAPSRSAPSRPAPSRSAPSRPAPPRPESSRPAAPPPSSAPSASPSSPSASRGASDQARYESAARLEASDPRAALAIYDSLARGGGPWAANALFAQARLELELGHRDRARRLLRSYLSRHPRGANAEDARQLLDQLR